MLNLAGDNNDMKHIRWDQPLTTFRGKHNQQKTKVFIVLDEAERWASGMTVKEIHLASGVPYKYLFSRLPQLVEWKYISRKAGVNGDGRPVYCYRLLQRGKNFLNVRVPRRKMNEYITEINTWRS